MATENATTEDSMLFSNAVDAIKKVIALSNELAETLEAEAKAYELMDWPTCTVAPLSRVSVVADLSLPDPKLDLGSIRLLGYVVVNDDAASIGIARELNALKDTAKECVAKLKTIQNRKFKLGVLRRDDGIEKLLGVYGLSRKLNLVALFRKVNVFEGTIRAIGYHGSFKGFSSVPITIGEAKRILSSRMADDDIEGEVYTRINRDLSTLSGLPDGRYIRREEVATAPVANVTVESSPGKTIRAKHYAALPFIITQSALAKNPRIRFPESLDEPRKQTTRWDKREYGEPLITSFRLYRID